MRLIPHERFTISSSHSVDTLRQRLRDNVEPTKRFRFRFILSRASKAFEGEVGESSFKIHRIIGYRNSFLPQIEGRFERVLNRTDIHVTFRLHPLVIGFLALWSGIVFATKLTATAGVIPGRCASFRREFSRSFIY
jgi:hypothetical protein